MRRDVSERMLGGMDASTLHGHFAAQAARTPDELAVSSDRVRLTYRQLNERANRLAHRLVGLGVGPNVPVAVLMERSADVIVAFLAAVKAGGCYMPLHDSYPPARLQQIVDHAGHPVIVADEPMVRRGLPRCGPLIVTDSALEAAMSPVADPSANPGTGAGPDHLAYIMHTSGSTGEPKGVTVTHRSALSTVLDECWDGGRHQRVLMAAPYAFGVSLYEVWVPLLRGGQVVVPPHGTPDVAILRRKISENQVTGIQLAAGLLRVVAEEAPDCLTGIREVITGGDTISPTAVQRIIEACPGIVIRTMYGSAELVTFSTGVPVSAPYKARATVPVGRPMNNTLVYVLDERLREVPRGDAGDLYIGGSRLAQGYLGRPDLTAERFIADPFQAGQRMFRTGDIARWTKDGLLDFLGRSDDQVKIRGFRVELAEVESAIASHPGAADVVITAPKTEQGERRLTAYVVATDDNLDIKALRAHATAVLPDYMVPSAFVMLDAFPVTPNGKVDRESLPEPGTQDSISHRLPRNQIEETLCSIFAQVLNAQGVGIDDDFFELGGDSLLAVRIASRITQSLGVALTSETVFNTGTVAELAEKFTRAADDDAGTLANKPNATGSLEAPV
jgi:amino acid adenylation domain-containing protein